jgi:hypothetical protein
MKTRLPLLAAYLFATVAAADEPFASGLKVGQRPMPYSFILATGPNRGTAFCYICDTADKPAAIVFARSLSDPLGKLAAQLDQAVADAKLPDFRVWLTLLDDGKSPSAEKSLVAWGQKHALRSVPLGVFEDPVGPPAYRLHKDADVTVVLFAKQKAVANFAFKTGELTDAKAAEIIKALDRLKSIGQ